MVSVCNIIIAKKYSEKYAEISLCFSCMVEWTGLRVLVLIEVIDWSDYTHEIFFVLVRAIYVTVLNLAFFNSQIWLQVEVVLK